MPARRQDKRVRQCIKTLKAQIIKDPHCRLMFAVFEQAVRDYFLLPRGTDGGYWVRSAREYLCSDWVHLALSGVDVSYARRVFSEAGLLLPQKK